MAPRARATLRAQWLGHLLRDLRDSHGMTLKEVGEYLQRDISTVSRFESGEHPIRRGDVMALLDLYAVEDVQQRDALLQLATEVWQKGWWEKYAGHVAGWVMDYVWLENRAREMRAYYVSPITGLLQLREYAAALSRAVDPDAKDEQIKKWTELRMDRQKILDGDDPLRLSVILDEAAIRRPIGGPSVMAAQLSHLLEYAARPNVEVQVLPFSVGAHASPDGSFRLLRMPDPFPEVAYVEGPAGSLYLESADAEHLATMYDRLKETALDAEESAEFISAVAREFE